MEDHRAVLTHLSMGLECLHERVVIGSWRSELQSCLRCCSHATVSVRCRSGRPAFYAVALEVPPIPLSCHTRVELGLRPHRERLCAGRPALHRLKSAPDVWLSARHAGPTQLSPARSRLHHSRSLHANTHFKGLSSSTKFFIRAGTERGRSGEMLFANALCKKKGEDRRDAPEFKRISPRKKSPSWGI